MTSADELPTKVPDGEQDERTFLIPIVTLKVPSEWTVGRATFIPASVVLDRVAELPTPHDGIVGSIVHTLEEAADGSFAQVRATSIEDAIDHATASLDALFVFMQSRALTTTTSFGMPGDLRGARTFYLIVDELALPGFKHIGEFPGFTFGEASVDDWRTSQAFQFVHRALANDAPSEGERRAAIGIQLLARAMHEHRVDLKILGVVSALEVMLLERSTGTQTQRLARHVAWFGCGVQASSLCGRDRPICPYLHLRPGSHRLTVLRRLGQDYDAWRCSEWLRVMDWYDSRSGAAHGDLPSVYPDEAKRAEYWVAHYLLEPILNWLEDHPDKPVEQLQNELRAIAAPQGWGAMLAALDSDPPPIRPPL